MGFLAKCGSGSSVSTCESCKKGGAASASVPGLVGPLPALSPLRVFKLEELSRATNQFSPRNLLGKGSHTCVYRGVLGDGRVVAVKRPTVGRRALQDVSSFDNELEVLSKLQHHPHLVNLLGYCSESQEKLLVVEFMPNGTLFDLLHPHSSMAGGAGERDREPLSWAMRVQMALQAAQAVLALHSASPPIIHRDIKSSNVLVDGGWNARLGDLGLALRGHLEDVVRRRTPPAGTMGYIDPEYETPSQLSTKSDVFSFGILLLEILSGRNAIDVRFNPSSIVDWAVPLIKQGRAMALCDPKLKPPSSKAVAKALKQLAAIAARSVRLSRERRPSMAEIVEGLKEISGKMPMSRGRPSPRVLLAAPARPSMVRGEGDWSDEFSDGEHSASSSILEGSVVEEESNSPKEQLGGSHRFFPIRRRLRALSDSSRVIDSDFGIDSPIAKPSPSPARNSSRNSSSQGATRGAAAAIPTSPRPHSPAAAKRSAAARPSSPVAGRGAAARPPSPAGAAARPPSPAGAAARPPSPSGARVARPPSPSGARLARPPSPTAARVARPPSPGAAARSSSSALAVRRFFSQSSSSQVSSSQVSSSQTSSSPAVAARRSSAVSSSPAAAKTHSSSPVVARGVAVAGSPARSPSILLSRKTEQPVFEPSSSRSMLIDVVRNSTLSVASPLSPVHSPIKILKDSDRSGSAGRRPLESPTFGSRAQMRTLDRMTSAPVESRSRFTSRNPGGAAAADGENDLEGAEIARGIQFTGRDPGIAAAIMESRAQGAVVGRELDSRCSTGDTESKRPSGTKDLRVSPAVPERTTSGLSTQRVNSRFKLEESDVVEPDGSPQTNSNLRTLRDCSSSEKASSVSPPSHLPENSSISSSSELPQNETHHENVSRDPDFSSALVHGKGNDPMTTRISKATKVDIDVKSHSNAVLNLQPVRFTRDSSPLWGGGSASALKFYSNAESPFGKVDLPIAV